MHEDGIEALRFLCEDSRRDRVDRLRELGLALRAIDGGVGGGVDDRLRRNRAHGLAQAVGLREVEAAPVETDHFTERRERAGELPADLPVRTGEQYLHGNTSASRNRAPAASRPESVGVPASGHLIARSGSFQAITRSCSGA